MIQDNLSHSSIERQSNNHSKTEQIICEKVKKFDDKTIQLDLKNYIILIQGLFYLLKKDTDKIKILFQRCLPEGNQLRAESMRDYIKKVLENVNFQSIYKMINLIPLNEGQYYYDLMKKILEEMSVETSILSNMFKLLDKFNKEKGNISVNEFEILRRRLNLSLSFHDIEEIFAKIKADQQLEIKKEKPVDFEEITEVNEDEFLESIEIVKQRQISDTMKNVGINPEVIYAHLLYITVILMLIFIFIFLGIKAFAMAGVFSAIINSFLPASRVIKLFSFKFYLVGAIIVGSDDKKKNIGKDKLKEATRIIKKDSS